MRLVTSPDSACTVYQYFASNGALLYVGVTDRGVRRSHEHAETKAWWPLAAGCTLEHYACREEALAREAHLIRTFMPPYNHQHNPQRHLTVDERTPAIGPRAPRSGEYAGMSLKERRRYFYALSSHERIGLPCVTCMQRPRHEEGRPSCLVCREAPASAHK